MPYRNRMRRPVGADTRLIGPALAVLLPLAGLLTLTLALLSPASALAASGGAGLDGGATSATASSTTGSHRYRGGSRHLGDRILREGMGGADVRQLQSLLTQAGYDTPVTGRFGPTTKGNVVAFQRAHRLRANGVVTWNVVRALRQAAASFSSDTVTSAPTGRAIIRGGRAVAPADAPAAVKAAIAAGNRIAFAPYVYGGGHGSWNDSGYDCSGSVSYALHGGRLISQPEDSGELEGYGRAGAGRWITIWANGGHVYMYVAGLRFDTSAQRQTGGSRWTYSGRSNGGFVERHPAGF